MNQNLKQIVLHTLLIFILLTISTNTVPVFAASNGMEEAEIEIKEVINQYFTLRYEEFVTHKSSDFSELVDRHSSITSNWRKTEKDRFDIFYKIATTFSDFVVDTEFWLDYLAIDISGKTATVTLIETNKMVYTSNLKNPSKMGNLQHKITLINGKNGWVIQNDQYVDDLTFVMNQLSMTEIFQNIESNHELITKNEKGNTYPPTPPTDIQNLDEQLTWHRYSYYAAANYVNRYYNSAGNIPVTVPKTPGWNTSWPMNYKVYSSDCINFISQAIYQGTSYTNSDGNSFYPDAANYSSGWYYKFSAPIDGSSPWINVEGLYHYLLRIDTEESMRGPVGESVDICDVNLNKGQPILMKLGDTWAHAGMIASKTGDCNITVNAHSTNYYHKPISYYSPYTWFPVQISGYYK